MPYPQLATPIAVPNGTRLVLTDFKEERSDPQDPDTVVSVQLAVELRSAPATNRLIGYYRLEARNGQSDELRVRPPGEYLAGMVIQDILEVRRAAVATPTGLDQLLAAWRGGSVSNRKVAVLTTAGTLGILNQASLAPSA